MGGGLLDVRDTEVKGEVFAPEEFNPMRVMNMPDAIYECNVIKATLQVC